MNDQSQNVPPPDSITTDNEAPAFVDPIKESNKALDGEDGALIDYRTLTWW